MTFADAVTPGAIALAALAACWIMLPAWLPNPIAALFSAVMVPLARAREMGNYDLSSPQALLRSLSDKRSYSMVTVKVARPKDTEEVEKKIRDMGFTAFSIADALQSEKKAFILMDLFLALIGSIALTVASLGIVNTMVMSILERTRDIGIMKAIGGGDEDIRWIFLVEASLIGLMGGVGGLLLGWLVGRGINYGANWYQRTYTGMLVWTGIAASSDGSKFYICNSSGGSGGSIWIYTQ